MGQVLVNESSLSGIASAIRQKNGTNNVYKPGQMAAAIQALPGASTLGTKSITANGNYAASGDNLDGYSSVSVNVPNSYAAGDEGKVVSNGELVAQTARSGAITQNGTYDTTNNSEVTVNVSGGGGGATILSGDSAPTAAQGSDGNVYLQYDGRIAPAGYNWLDYIYSDGYQYINTGYVPSDTTVIEITANIDSENGEYSAISGTLGEPYMFIITHINGSPNLTAAWAGADQRSNTYDITGDIVTIRWTKGRVIVTRANGTEVCNWSFTAGTASLSKPLYLFTAYGKTRGRAAAAKLYRAKIYEGNSLIHDYIPVQRESDDKPGLYDLETDTFLVNGGSGEFTPSAVRPDRVILGAFVKVSGAWQNLIGSGIDNVGGITV